MRVSWTARRSNQSILTEISPEYSLEELMLKLKLQYFGHLRQSIGSLEKTLMTEDEMVGRHHQLNEHEFEQALGDGVDCHSLLQRFFPTEGSNTYPTLQVDFIPAEPHGKSMDMRVGL